MSIRRFKFSPSLRLRTRSESKPKECPESSDSETETESEVSVYTAPEMPLSATKFSIESRVVVARRSCLDTSWGATILGSQIIVSKMLTPVFNATISDLTDNGIAEQCGIKCGDQIVAVNGNTVDSWTHEKLLVVLKNLKEVHFTILPSDSQKVKYLYFSDVITSHLEYIWALANLVSLYICDGDFEKTVIDLSNVTCRNTLTELSITRCNISLISQIKGLERLRYLRKLILNHNNLSSIGEEICKLCHLKELQVGYNSLEIFPLVVTKIHTLENLSLVFNLISTIPPQIIQLLYLRTLHLDNNFLTELPLYVTHQLHNLTSLTFSSNQLPFNEEKISDYFHLDVIDFSNNGMRTRTGLDGYSLRKSVRPTGLGISPRGLKASPMLSPLSIAKTL